MIYIHSPFRKSVCLVFSHISDIPHLHYDSDTIAFVINYN